MNCRDDSIEQPLRGWFYYIKLIRELTRFHAFLLGVPLQVRDLNEANMLLPNDKKILLRRARANTRKDF